MQYTIIKYLPVLCIFCSSYAIAQSNVTMGGYTDLTLYGLAGVTGNTNVNRQYTHSASYANGPMFLQTDYLDLNAGSDGNNEHTSMTGFAYDFRYLKTYLAYSTSKSSNNIVTQNNADTLIGFSIPYVNHALMASFINQIDKSDPATNVAAKQFSLAYTYQLSHSTNLYISRSHTDTVISNVNPMSTISGLGCRDVQIGVHHAF
jgi:Gram-negative porin